MKFDEGWRRVAGFVYPDEVVERFEDMSNSGGTWAEDGRLYATFALGRETDGHVFGCCSSTQQARSASLAS